jgi:hypothetical protein
LNERGDDEQAPDVGQMSDVPGKLVILSPSGDYRGRAPRSRPRPETYSSGNK